MKELGKSVLSVVMSAVLVVSMWPGTAFANDVNLAIGHSNEITGKAADELGDSSSTDGSHDAVDSLEPQSGLTAQSNVDGLNYKVEANGDVTISGPIDKNISSITIPSEIDGRGVTKIGSSAFQDCDALTSVALPDTVEDIGTDAFYGCDKLSSVTLPDNQWGCTIGSGTARSTGPGWPPPRWRRALRTCPTACSRAAGPWPP